MHVAVIGAGPAGLSCAIQLIKRGVSVDVFEAEGRVGGMSKSFELWNMVVDLGPHRFFSMDPRIAQFWIDQIKDDYVLVDRLTRIYYKRKFFYYPLKPFDAVLKLGPIETMNCVISFVRAMLSRVKEQKTFAQWVSKRFGQRLYEIFFKSYSEKLWGISCDDLDANFAAQRIKGLNLFEAIKNALLKGKTRHKTLIEQFAYPENGAGEVYERMAQRFVDLGGKIHLRCPVKCVVVNDDGSGGVETEQSTIEFDHIISTMPLTDVIEGSSFFSPEAKQACKNLRYRNTTLVYLCIDSTDIFRDNWIYIHAPDLKTGRITNFRNWSKNMLHGQNKSILMLEYWSYDHEPLWTMSDEALIDLSRKEIIQTGLVRPDTIGDGHVVRIHRSYPVYSSGYNNYVKILQKEIDAIPWLTCIGRNGAFKYNNQDHSILMGLLAAENIVDQAGHDLWKVNTDYDYQEGKSAFCAD